MTRGLTFHQMMVGLLFGAVAVFACLMPAQGDTFWHLRAGQDIWRTLHVPLDDHYSYTVVGGFWPNHEWLWQALSYGLQALGGMPLLELGGAAIIVGACVILYRLCVGAASVRFLLMLLILPLATRAWALRPQLLTMLALALLLWLLVYERYRWLPLLFVVWANAHAAVVMGIVVLGACAALAVARARPGDAPARRRAVALGVLTPICAVTTLLTPLGFGLWRFIGTSVALSRANRILEWQPTWPDAPFGIVFWSLALPFLVIAFRWWRRARRRGPLSEVPWGDAVLAVASLILLALAARAIRNTCVFLMIAVPAASRMLGADFRLRRRSAEESPDHPRVNLTLLVAISALEAVGIVYAWRLPYDGLGWRPIPDGALAAVRACPGEVFGRYNDGGPLIWFVPEKRVFSDTRQDPYPLSITRETVAIEHGGPYRETFAHYGIRCAILPVTSQAATRLAADGWQARFRDDAWTVLATPDVAGRGPS